jgi:hypothetical protein
MIPDVGDSFEAQLLQSMKREVAEECGNGTSDDDHRGGGHNLSQYRYGSDDLSDSSDDMSTLKVGTSVGGMHGTWYMVLLDHSGLASQRIIQERRTTRRPEGLPYVKT